MYFWNYRLPKTWLEHSLESVVSELPLRVNMLKDPKHLLNLHDSTCIIFFIITMRRIGLQNICFSEISHARDVC